MFNEPWETEKRDWNWGISFMALVVAPLYFLYLCLSWAKDRARRRS